MADINEMDDVERVEPIRITDNDTGKVYELDFSRESVRYVEQQGYKVDETFDFPNVNIPKLFYFAFRKNHRNVSLQKTNEILDKMGGITEKIGVRLVALYNQATMSNNIIQDEDDLAKNSHVTVEL